MENIEPGRILVAGDWHGDYVWAMRVLKKCHWLLDGEQDKIVLHLGDFGIWPDDTRYLGLVNDALVRMDATLWFIDGNHEEHPRLLEARSRQLDAGEDGPVRIGYDRIRWLYRGYRWNWHGREWLACGGAVSTDHSGLVRRRVKGQIVREPHRTEGRDWWPEEEITDAQEAMIISGGHADVMVAHDYPDGVTHSFPDTPAWWSQADLLRAEDHRKRMQRIADAVQPGWYMHGHLHRHYSRTCNFGYGPVQVSGLACNGMNGNYEVLDTRTMEWAA